jgi:uncharacterized DUF497 family protein
MSRYVAEFEFEWDDGNRKHIARHGVTPEEAEEVITSHPLVLEVQFRNRERVGSSALAVRGRTGRWWSSIPPVEVACAWSRRSPPSEA